MRGWDPAQWEMRWWLPLAALATAAGLWFDKPEVGRPIEPAIESSQPSYAPVVRTAAECGTFDVAEVRARCAAGETVWGSEGVLEDDLRR